MPTKRKRVTRNPIKDIPPWKIHYLQHGNLNIEGLTEKEINHIEWGYLYDFSFPEKRRPVWEKLRSQIMASWLDRYPSTRPAGWWEHDCPGRDGVESPDPRQKVGGGGEVCNYNIIPKYERGVWRHWFYQEDNPPLMESEAAYLQRLNLLTEKEKNHLSKNPHLLEPIPINEIGDFRPQRRIEIDYFKGESTAKE